MKKAAAAAVNVLWQDEFKALLDQMRAEQDLMMKVLKAQVQATTQVVASTRRLEESMNKIETIVIPGLQTEVLVMGTILKNQLKNKASIMNSNNNGTTIEEIFDTKQIKTIDALKEYLLSSSFVHIVT